MEWYWHRPLEKPFAADSFCFDDSPRLISELELHEVLVIRLGLPSTDDRSSYTHRGRWLLLLPMEWRQERGQELLNSLQHKIGHSQLWLLWMTLASEYHFHFPNVHLYCMHLSSWFFWIIFKCVIYRNTLHSFCK